MRAVNSPSTKTALAYSLSASIATTVSWVELNPPEPVRCLMSHFETASPSPAPSANVVASSA
jgi:hypothetical protein